MFIKWREVNKPPTQEWIEANKHLFRPGRGKRNPSWHRFYAYLAESHRVNGKPRQRIITYLGSIPAIEMQEDTSREWEAFWYKVYCSLCLADVDFSTYQTVMFELGKRVKRPCDHESLIRIVAEQFASHPQWHKDYDAIARVLEKDMFSIS